MHELVRRHEASNAALDDFLEFMRHD